MIMQRLVDTVGHRLSVSRVGLTVVVAVASVVASAQPSWSQSRSIWEAPVYGESGFWCSTSSGTPTTVFRNVEGRDDPWIRWTSSYFTRAGYSNWERCTQVSARLNRLRDREQLNYITVGMMNGERVICAASQINGRCLESDGLILTLKPGQDAVGTLMRLMDWRYSLATVPSLYESGSVPYIDVRARLAAGGEISSQPQAESGVQTVPRSNNRANGREF